MSIKSVNIIVRKEEIIVLNANSKWVKAVLLLGIWNKVCYTLKNKP